MMLIAFPFAAAVSVTWFFCRHESWAWVLQNLMSHSLCGDDAPPLSHSRFPIFLGSNPVRLLAFHGEAGCFRARMSRLTRVCRGRAVQILSLIRVPNLRITAGLLSLMFFCELPPPRHRRLVAAGGGRGCMPCAVSPSSLQPTVLSDCCQPFGPPSDLQNSAFLALKRCLSLRCCCCLRRHLLGLHLGLFLQEERDGGGRDGRRRRVAADALHDPAQLRVRTSVRADNHTKTTTARDGPDLLVTVSLEAVPADSLGVCGCS